MLICHIVFTEYLCICQFFTIESLNFMQYSQCRFFSLMYLGYKTEKECDLVKYVVVFKSVGFVRFF